jgi:sterol desaturase/sphingolipid hydroxylase (fatty acid hydroxylase superfamily)
MFDSENFRELILVLISTPIYIIFIGLEIILSNRRKKGYYTLKDSISNVYLMLLNMGLDILLRAFVYFVLLYFFTTSPLLGTSGSEGAFVPSISNPILYWIILFFLEDFAFYWLHRVDHVTRLFWSVHVTHHSSSKFNLTTGFRSSVFQPLYRFVYFIPIAFLGFHPLDIFFMYSATQIYGILVHTQLVDKMGVFEHILVTPSHHRVHHASNIPFLDKNMGMILIIWDKLFGTFQAEDSCEEKIEYGLTTKQELDMPLEVVTHEWKTLFKDVGDAKGFGTKLKILFSPPGWLPEDVSQTSKALQKEYWKDKNVGK